MRYIKIYEKVYKHKIGDYILLDLNSIRKTNYHNSNVIIPTNEIDKLIEYSDDTGLFIYLIDFPYASNGKNKFYLKECDILASSSNKEDLEIISKINKYNL